MSRAQHGFTFMEMTIVLMVVALMLGSILVGKTMVHEAELRTVMSDVDRYKKAIQLFKEKYKALPGDMPNATSFWGTDAGGCPSTPANATPKTTTCDGNGNGFIGDATGSALGGATAWYESYRVWQHLSDAGMIEGQYSGALSSRTTGHNADPGLNVPASKINTAAYTLLYAAPVSVGINSGGVFGANYRHIIVFGAPVSQYASAYAPAISAMDAFKIDQKMDDSAPGTGNVLSFTPDLASTPSCASSHVESTATYNSSSSNTACSLIFITGF